MPGGAENVPAARVPSRLRMRWRKALIVLAVLFVTFWALTARLFIWPAQGMPPRVNAIVMLDGPGGSALNVAARLAAQHRAPSLVIIPRRGGLPRSVPPAGTRGDTDLLQPVPATTQGEAEFIGQLARKYHWQSVAIVAITPQVSRARLRVERCFAGQVYGVTAPIRPSAWPYEIAYEWAAMVKALVIQRGC